MSVMSRDIIEKHTRLAYPDSTLAYRVKTTSTPCDRVCITCHNAARHTVAHFTLLRPNVLHIIMFMGIMRSQVQIISIVAGCHQVHSRSHSHSTTEQKYKINDAVHRSVNWRRNGAKWMFRLKIISGKATVKPTPIPFLIVTMPFSSSLRAPRPCWLYSLSALRLLFYLPWNPRSVLSESETTRIHKWQPNVHHDLSRASEMFPRKCSKALNDIAVSYRYRSRIMFILHFHLKCY